ncbi:hypothetical protein ACQ86N_17465 [Puia sp. P3]|uniref:hypothetical protein n=1 Tax=Puia sp. P3 TaxID=3423952 RepID=UPI003D665C47
MEINILDTYEDLSRHAAEVLFRQLDAKKDMLLCAATGNSPTRTYQLLAEECGRRPERFAAMRVLKLDEWGGIPPTTREPANLTSGATSSEPLEYRPHPLYLFR